MHSDVVGKSRFILRQKEHAYIMLGPVDHKPILLLVLIETSFFIGSRIYLIRLSNVLRYFVYVLIPMMKMNLIDI